VDIRLVNGTDEESRTADALRALASTYDLRAWTYTERIDIDERACPHSHPVLTLTTGHSSVGHLLAGLVHEQLHWVEESRAVQRDAVVESTRELYPDVPAARPEGAGDEASTRLHLLVCLLEYRVLALLLGYENASRLVSELGEHHYRWIYRTVQRDAGRIEAIARAHGMLPAPLDERPADPTGRCH
jgi:hypothetical protein